MVAPGRRPPAPARGGAPCETYADIATGVGVGTTTLFRYADPSGRLIWASPASPGARHDMGAAREHGILDALAIAGVRVIADNGYRGSGFAVPQRRRRCAPRPVN